MILLGLKKRAVVSVDQTIRWIIWIAVLIASGLAVRAIVSNAVG